jgi:hypothetical protein
MELGKLVGLEGDKGISAIENGRANVQSERYYLYCEALGMTHQDFAKVVLRHTDPWIYKAIVGSREQALIDKIGLIEAAVKSKGDKPEWTEMKPG